MKLGWKLLIAVVLLLSLGSLYLIEDKFMGNVVWEPITMVDNCSDTDIRALWNEVFPTISPIGITIFNKTGTNCKEFVALEQVGVGPVYFLYGNNTYTSEMNMTWVNATYGNLTSVAAAAAAGHTDFAGIYSFLLGLDEEDFIDWDVTDNTTAMTKFQNVIGATAPYFIDVPTNTDWFGFLDLELDMHVPGTSTSLLYEGYVSKNYSRVSMGYFNSSSYTAFDVNAPTLLENISDYNFEQNSSWNTAFAIADHFVMDPDVYVGFSYTGGGTNAGGVLVNWTIENGQVKFNPATGFNGSLEFMLSAMGDGGTTDSNFFWVNIVPDINYPPVFTGIIDDILLNRTTNLSIFLGQYFEDPDETTLTYNVSNENNMGIVFAGGEMYIWLKSNFTGFENFKITASDGVYQISSNKITVFLDNSSGSSSGEDPLGDFVDDSTLVVPRGLSAPGTTENNSGDGSEGGGKIGFWIFIIVGVVLVLSAVGVVIYFKFFDQGPVQGPVQKNTAVSDYLNKINSQNFEQQY